MLKRELLARVDQEKELPHLQWLDTAFNLRLTAHAQHNVSGMDTVRARADQYLPPTVRSPCYMPEGYDSHRIWDQSLWKYNIAVRSIRRIINYSVVINFTGSSVLTGRKRNPIGSTFTCDLHKWRLLAADAQLGSPPPEVGAAICGDRSG